MRRTLLALVVGSLAVAVLTTPALAAGGSPAGQGPGGGEETLGNNLSVPAVFVGGTTGAPALRIACADAGDGVAPGVDGVPTSTLYPGYWLQKTAATWSAACATATSASVVADWGDNLTGTTAVAAGKPIRVEVGLLDPAATGRTGYTITKLTPDLADRLATYGTNGDSFASAASGPTTTRVWDPQASLLIETLSGGVPGGVVYSGAAVAEINSGGAVVYGYNWGSKGKPPAAGSYRITFSVSDATTFIGLADGTPRLSYTDHSTVLHLTLTSSRGGSGR
jgi:hypothetical protein